MARAKAETFWWALFSAGGMAAAFLMPVTILLLGFTLPYGYITTEELFELLHNPFVRLYLFAVISAPLLHAAHRLQHTLADVGLKPMKSLIAFLFYGGAIAGSGYAGWLLWQIQPAFGG